jgi:double zinc ribbon protein
VTCPQCGIENPPSAQYCDCGYEFEPGSKPKETLRTATQGTQCPKCKTFNSATSQFCSKCGAGLRRKRSPVLAGCLGVIGIAVLIIVFSNRGTDTSGGTPSGTASSSGAPQNAKQTSIEPEPSWSYSDDEDAMGRKQSVARVASSNTLQFGFPYQGSQRGSLIIRKSAGSTDVMVRIERGQFICGIETCNVNVRFDHRPIQRFSASQPSDHSTTTLFLNNESRFISQVRKAKVVHVEATFYQEGSQALEFNVDGFTWP